MKTLLHFALVLAHLTGVAWIDAEATSIAPNVYAPHAVPAAYVHTLTESDGGAAGPIVILLLGVLAILFYFLTVFDRPAAKALQRGPYFYC